MKSTAISTPRRTAPAAAQAARATTTQRARSVGMSASTAAAGTRWSARCSTPTSVHRSVPLCCSTVRPASERVSSTNHRSAPSPACAATRMRWAAQIPSVEPVEPFNRQLSPSRTACTDECSGRTTAAVAPSASSVSNGVAAVPARAATALAVAVLNSGPGSRAAAAASMTQAMSANVPPWPPASSGMCTALKPLAVNSSHQDGNSPAAMESNAARVLSTGACRAANLVTASASCSCSVVIANAIGQFSRPRIRAALP